LRKYETIFILKSNVSDGDVQSYTESVKNLIEKNNGIIQKIENWGKKKLAYEIKKEKFGHYLVITFDSNPEFISILDKSFRLNENILRHLIVFRYEPEEKKEKGKSQKEVSSWEAAEDKAAVNPDLT